MKAVYETWQDFYADLSEHIVGEWRGWGTHPFPDGYPCSYTVIDLERLNKDSVVWRLGQKEEGELLRFEPTQQVIWIKERYLNQKAEIIPGIPVDVPGPDRKFVVVFAKDPDSIAIETFPFVSHEAAAERIRAIKEQKAKETQSED
jgi:hypothetical protein